MISTGLLLFVWMIVYAAIININAIGTSEEILVIGEITKKLKHNTTYTFIINSDYRESPIGFKVSKTGFNKYNIGDYVQFKKRLGLLGILYSKRY